MIDFVPSVLIYLILLRWVDLGLLKDSAFGRYVRKYMTRSAQAVRLIGYAIMAAVAWLHQVWLLPVGSLVILMA